jgi:hypothetical protein
MTQQLPGPFPLSWPSDWNRTKSSSRRNSRYHISFVGARNDLLQELRRYGVSNAVITSNLMARADGLPYANQREPEDPGIAVWWYDRLAQTMRVMPCDTWHTTRENLRAIGKAVEALRILKTCGAGQIQQRAEQVFDVKSLPGSDSKHPWWFDRLKLEHWPPTREDIRKAFRRRSAETHPDKGGDNESFLDVGRAFVDAEAWLEEQ